MTEWLLILCLSSLANCTYSQQLLFHQPQPFILPVIVTCFWCPFPEPARHFKIFSLNMIFKRLWFTSCLPGIGAVKRASWNASLRRTVPHSLPALFSWGQVHPVLNSGRGGTRDRDQEEEEEERDRSIIHLEHFPLFMKHCKPDRQAANKQFISSVAWDAPLSSATFSYFQGHTVRSQLAGPGDWAPYSSKGSFHVKLEVIVAVEG